MMLITLLDLKGETEIFRTAHLTVPNAWCFLRFKGLTNHDIAKSKIHSTSQIL